MVHDMIGRNKVLIPKSNNEVLVFSPNEFRLPLFLEDIFGPAHLLTNAEAVHFVHYIEPECNNFAREKKSSGLKNTMKDKIRIGQIKNFISTAGISSQSNHQRKGIKKRVPLVMQQK